MDYAWDSNILVYRRVAEYRGRTYYKSNINDDNTIFNMGWFSNVAIMWKYDVQLYSIQ